jgi:hypothetical protein
MNYKIKKFNESIQIRYMRPNIPLESDFSTMKQKTLTGKTS